MYVWCLLSWGHAPSLSKFLLLIHQCLSRTVSQINSEFSRKNAVLLLYLTFPMRVLRCLARKTRTMALTDGENNDSHNCFYQHWTDGQREIVYRYSDVSVLTRDKICVAVPSLEGGGQLPPPPPPLSTPVWQATCTAYVRSALT